MIRSIASAAVVGAAIIALAPAGAAQAQATVLSCWGQPASCSKQPLGPGLGLPPPKTFAAVAMSGSGFAMGWASGYAKASSAEAKALSRCHQAEEDCKIVITFTSGCAALVHQPSTGRWWLERAELLGAAQQRALTACKSAGVADCKVNPPLCAEE
jgi:hypothetical protein